MAPLNKDDACACMLPAVLLSEARLTAQVLWCCQGHLVPGVQGPALCQCSVLHCSVPPAAAAAPGLPLLRSLLLLRAAAPAPLSCTRLHLLALCLPAFRHLPAYLEGGLGLPPPHLVLQCWMDWATREALHHLFAFSLFLLSYLSYLLTYLTFLPGFSAQCRVGWATREAELNGPVGADLHGYSYRSKEGSKVRHLAKQTGWWLVVGRGAVSERAPTATVAKQVRLAGNCWRGAAVELLHAVYSCRCKGGSKLRLPGGASSALHFSWCRDDVGRFGCDLRGYSYSKEGSEL